MITVKIPRNLCVGLLALVLFACGTTAPPSRYQQKHDSIPTRLPNASELHDATPRSETPSRGGNKNYQVFGKPYQVMSSAKGFSQSGIASWYGRKFHGHLTSNGEIYDMYAMSAAHKNLPLPTYVKVVNNANGRSVIVRVNDRGPFHQNRIIDLSYSAAYKLDMLKTGTANVTITAITDFSATTAELETPKLNNIADSSALTASPTNTSSPTSAQSITVVEQPITPASVLPISNNDNVKRSPLTSLPPQQYIQVFASNSLSQAEQLAKALSSLHQKNTELEQKNGIIRVLVGPITRSDELSQLLLAIKDSGYPKAFIRK
ncbi:MAG: septal ring lytic transglycosylase RlpA family protein [Cognaticolwellia sp.]